LLDSLLQESFLMSDQDEVVDYPFPNEDANIEPGAEKAATLVWVGVANSTKHKLKINWSVTGARRKTIPKILFNFTLGVSIPGVGDFGPKFVYERGEVSLEQTGDSSSGTKVQSPCIYEKLKGNADTDEKSKLVHLEFYKDGETEWFWQTAVEKKHGVIVIEDPDDSSKLSVIPAAGQFIDSKCWKPQSKVRHPKMKKTYDPMRCN